MKKPKFLIQFLFVILLYWVAPCNATGVILVLGDSLSAGYKLQPKEGWVDILANKITNDNLDFKVVNASVAGITTADGLKSLPGLLTKNNPNILILALGSNDGLRNVPILVMKQNIDSMIDLAQGANAKVLMVGFKLPLNYSVAYRDEFSQAFVDISDQYELPLVPFLLNGIALNPSYFQQDRLHPNAKAQQFIFDNVWEYLEPMLDG